MKDSYVYLAKYDGENIQNISQELQKVRIRVIRYIAIALLFVALVFAVSFGFTNQQNLEIGFYFYTSAFVVIIILIKLFFTLYSLSNVKFSLEMLKEFKGSLDEYLFEENQCDLEKALIGIRNKSALFVVSHNAQDQFFAVFALDKGLHKSEAKLLENQRKQFDQAVLDPKYFIEINENF